MDANLGQPCASDWTHSPHQLDRQVMKKIQLSLGIDHHQSVRLGHLRGNFREMLGACHADRDWKAKLRAHTTTYCSRDLRRRTEKVGASRNVSKSLVDGNPFDERSEIIKHIDGSIAQPLVILEMPADKDQLRTQLTSPASRHTATDSKRLGFVRGGEHHPAANGDGFAAQGRVKQLLDRCIEGIKVRMEDGGCSLHPDGTSIRRRRWPDKSGLLEVVMTDNRARNRTNFVTWRRGSRRVKLRSAEVTPVN